MPLVVKAVASIASACLIVCGLYLVALGVGGMNRPRHWGELNPATHILVGAGMVVWGLAMIYASLLTPY